jgi:hypothetical protein
MEQRILKIAMVTACIAGIAIGSAQADVITTFDATGTFADGAALSGYLMIDETIGVVTAADLLMSAPDSLAFTVVQAQQGNYPVNGDYQIDFALASNPSGLPNLNFVIPVGSLVDYAGGNLESFTQSVNGLASVLFPAAGPFIGLEQGALTAAPEPSSMLILSAGVLMLGAGAVYRRHRAF